MRASLVVIDLLVPSCNGGTQRRFGLWLPVANSLHSHAFTVFFPEL
jgi:hypothetical protein